ncbi:sugar-phosphatase [Streptoalloteichus tenebrarius]|uniref:Sugar-phosphatase n=1 Tax=Streptoalloteichus tenebrarius (strain ATCC 17920 / DSM 40477 / JCM 4838 / CBS 697.72 / NBRC 16177 / NCIMB 11028 / NRRL B-12390 / A12253. 1 / ISP 5477) TaxID=1933 RepID=A0ABT1HM07_STRSD|nr:HAD-IA family hydrolase [Streptoalloteichus tenebrarius]MCP2256551.1 sugar-phosphatase [Streptoalloteichus tenebrarius]BFF04905.1 HAD family hydrolase [Streptoalloteichus tenebrarius]
MEIGCAALLFDADGTLVDSRAAVERCWGAWAELYGLDVAAVLAVCQGRRSEETIARFLPADEVEPAVARLDALELADLADVEPCPGVPELLAALDGPGRPSWAVVTSGILPLVTGRMRAAGLALPEVVVTAESVTAGKPDPQGYRLAARRLGVPIERCVVVEDAPVGVRAGREAGARVVAVTTTHTAEELSEADVVVESLGQLVVGDGTLTVVSPGREVGV